MLAPRITRAEAKALAFEEFDRYARLIDVLSDEELAQPTECTTLACASPDPFDFVRTLCGRLPGSGVLANPLPL